MCCTLQSGIHCNQYHRSECSCLLQSLLIGYCNLLSHIQLSLPNSTCWPQHCLGLAWVGWVEGERGATLDPLVELLAFHVLMARRLQASSMHRRTLSSNLTSGGSPSGWVFSSQCRDAFRYGSTRLRMAYSVAYVFQYLLI